MIDVRGGVFGSPLVETRGFKMLDAGGNFHSTFGVMAIKFGQTFADRATTTWLESNVSGLCYKPGHRYAVKGLRKTLCYG